MATAFIFSSNIEVSGIEKDSNNLRVLCSPKIRATTERNASYLQFLGTTGTFFGFLLFPNTQHNL